MVCSSAWIRERCERDGMIAPFVDPPVRKGVISYGLGPYGYDIRLAGVFLEPQLREGILDPRGIEPGDFVECRRDPIDLPPGSFILGRSVETFRIPREVIGVAWGKSTYARVGVLVNVTPLEPEWTGVLTLSIANTGCRTVRLHPGQGIAQILFLLGSAPPLFSYRDLGGKYDGQVGATPARIE